MIPLDEHVLNRLHSYLDCTLSLVDSAAVRRHCAQCQSCRETLVRLAAERTTHPWQSGGAAPRSARATARLAGGSGPFFGYLWLTLALAAVVLAVFSVHYIALKPSPYDLRVLGQTEWMPGTDAAIHLRVLRHDDAHEPGVPVTVELRDPSPGAGRRVQLASLTTGENGAALPRFRLPDWPDGRYQLQVTASPPGAGNPETFTRTVALKHSCA